MKLRRVLIPGFALFLLVAVASAWTVLGTTAGARWVLARVEAATAGAFRYDTVDGSLVGGFVLTAPGYTSDAVNVVADRLGLEAAVSLFPLTVTVAVGEAAGLVVDLPAPEPDAEPGEAPDIEAILESLALPLVVSVEQLTIDGLAFRRGDELLFGIEQLALAFDWHERIDLESLTVTGDGFRARLAVDVALEAPFELAANGDGEAEPALTGLSESLDLSLALTGSLERLAVEVTEAATGLRISGDLLELLREPAWDLDATLTAYELPGTGGVVRDAALSTSGRPDRYGIELAGNVTGLVGGPDAVLDLDLVATGSTTAIEVDSLTAGHPWGGATLEGRFDFPARFAGTVELDRLALEELVPSLEAAHVVAGSARVDVSPARIAVADGDFRLAGAPTRVTVTGELDVESRVVAADVGWQALHWPLLEPDARLRSREGRATLSGTLDDWRADVTTLLAATGVAEGRFRLRSEGTRERAAVDIVEGAVFGGVIDGAATIDWSGVPAWQADLGVRGLRTAAIAPAYPGILSGRVAAVSLDSPASARVEIRDLRGTILDEPLSGSGDVTIAPSNVSTTALRLSHGEAELTANGELYGPAGMDFDLTVPDLGRYGAAFDGDIELGGNVGLGRMPPRLELRGESRFLRVGGVRVDDVAIDTRETAAGGVAIEATAGEVDVGPRRLDALRLRATLDPDVQDLAVDFEALGSDVGFAMTGSFSEPLSGRPPGFPWVGELRSLSLAIKSGEGGGLDAPAPLRLSPDAVVLERACLSGNERGTLCAAFEAVAGRGLSLDAEADGMPIDVLNSLLQTGFEFEQSVSGSVSWQQPDGGRPNGRVRLRFSKGQLKSSRFPGLDLATGDGILEFELEDGQLLSGQLDMPIGPRGFVRGNFDIVDIERGGDSEIEGSLAARTADVDVLAALLPDTEDTSGRIEVDITIGGTVNEPAIIGVASVENAAATYFPLGLKLSDVNLRADFDENQQIDLEGSFRAGDGFGEIQTTTRSANGEEAAGIHVRVRGNRLAVIDLPDINALADADLRLDYQDRRLDIGGSLDIPSARVRPVDLTRPRVTTSDDVEIVAGTLPDSPVTEEKPPAIAIHGELALGMGDDVMIVLDRARASISGRTEFEWSGDPVPIGRGGYSINGTVQAFGQVLDISEGAVRFPAVPVTDPLLDIRATREIYGNSQVKRAGVLVQGPLSRPTIEAYTFPMTTEERALTLLVTGNDFNAEKEVGAIDFGTYIAPRLFLSYGIGVFDRENIISARYDLTEGFGIRATSGQNASGIDLTYRLER